MPPPRWPRPPTVTRMARGPSSSRPPAHARVAAPADVHRDGRRAVLVAPRDHRQDELVRRRGLDLERPEDGVTEGGAAEAEAPAKHRGDLRQRVPQAGHDSEVAATASKAPQQLGLTHL